MPFVSDSRAIHSRVRKLPPSLLAFGLGVAIPYLQDLQRRLLACGGSLRKSRLRNAPVFLTNGNALRVADDATQGRKTCECRAMCAGCDWAVQSWQRRRGKSWRYTNGTERFPYARIVSSRLSQRLVILFTVRSTPYMARFQPHNLDSHVAHLAHCHRCRHRRASRG